MTWLDEDLHPVVVSGAPAAYRYNAQKSVFAVPIEVDGEKVAYLFHGSDEEPDTGGLIVKLEHEFFRSNAEEFWDKRSSQSFSNRVPAAEA